MSACHTHAVTTPDQPKWLRSTYCSGGSCVEVAQHDDRILVRDGKNPDQPHLSFNRTDWLAFLEDVPRA